MSYLYKLTMVRICILQLPRKLLEPAQPIATLLASYMSNEELVRLLL
jgi:hypothetical protein